MLCLLLSTSSDSWSRLIRFLPAPSRGLDGPAMGLLAVEVPGPGLLEDEEEEGRGEELDMEEEPEVPLCS